MDKEQNQTEEKSDDTFIDVDVSPIDIENKDDYEHEEIIVPSEKATDNSYLSLILNPNLRELELYIRGLENVKVYDPRQGKEVIKMRKVKTHFLNERGINAMLQELKLHTSSDMTLQRISEEDYRLKTQQVGQTFHRLIFKSLKEFGMDTHEKQRNARRLWLAIKNKVDAAYSRAIGGKENDLSHARIELHGEIGGLGETPPYFEGKNGQGNRPNNKMGDIRN